MQTKDKALAIIDRMLAEARTKDFSYVAIRSGTVAKILQTETAAEHHAMPTVCHALAERFRPGRDFFRRGKDRHEWQDRINGDETSTFEVLFEIER